MKGIITIDIGNSSISLGLFDGYDLVCKASIKTLTNLKEEECIDKIRDLLRHTEAIGGGIISSVVPEITDIVYSAHLKATGIRPLILGRDLESGLFFDVLVPREVGSDRIANVVAAARLYGEPAVVVDFGTATTLSIIRNNTFVGGTIIPGLEMMARALNSYTSCLPLINLRDLFETKRHIGAFGKDTRQNIISGIIYATAGAVERMIREIEGEQGCRFRIVLTGGFSVIMARFLKMDFSLDPDLTLKGLRFLYERSKDA